MSDASAPPPPPPPPRSVEEEAEQLARELAHDTLKAARRGWKIATELGAAALTKAESITNEVADDVRKRRHGGTNPPPPPPPGASQP